MGKKEKPEKEKQWAPPKKGITEWEEMQEILNFHNSFHQNHSIRMANIVIHI